MQLTKLILKLVYTPSSQTTANMYHYVWSSPLGLGMIEQMNTASEA